MRFVARTTGWARQTQLAEWGSFRRGLPRSTRGRSQRGTTLVEILAATVIIGIIAYALTESLVSGLTNSGDSTERVGGSIDRQRVASAFVPDAQSAKAWDATATGVAGPCGADLNPDQMVMNLRWSDAATGLSSRVATYFVEDGELFRRFCEGAPDDPASDDPVAPGSEKLAELGDGWETMVAEPVPGDLALRLCPAACPNVAEDVPRPGYEVRVQRRVTP
ncbi:MAG: type II secretion system protein [Acidimicrobiales bacterium]